MSTLYELEDRLQTIEHNLEILRKAIENIGKMNINDLLNKEDKDGKGKTKPRITEE